MAPNLPIELTAVISINNVKREKIEPEHWTDVFRLVWLFRFQITEYAYLSLIWIAIADILYCDSYKLREFYPEIDILFGTHCFSYSDPVDGMQWLQANEQLCDKTKDERPSVQLHCSIDTCSIFRINIGKLPFIPPSSIYHRVSLLIYSTLSIRNPHKWTKFDFAWKQKSDAIQCFVFVSMLHIKWVNWEKKTKQKRFEKAKTKYYFYSKTKS